MLKFKILLITLFFLNEYSWAQSNIDCSHVMSNVSLVRKVLQKDLGSNGFYGSHDEVEIVLQFDGKPIAVYTDFGDGEYDSESFSLSLQSDLAVKIYTISCDNENLIVDFEHYFDGEGVSFWTRKYALSWIEILCEGECDF